MKKTDYEWYKSFQLTASQGGWPIHVDNKALKQDISTHSLTRRLTLSASASVIFHQDFNSQPHKEADDDEQKILLKRSLFQLTASQGGWHELEERRKQQKKFQLTASQGGWRSIYTVKRNKVDISTHSLTRRLTNLETIRRLPLIFQLTASQGGWQYFFKFCDISQIFQLTASQGGWLSSRFQTVLLRHFNSQPHKEADSNFIQ